MSTNTDDLDTCTLRSLAVAADADPRSVRRELAKPGSVRGLSGHRIRKVLRERGLAPTTPKAQRAV